MPHPPDEANRPEVNPIAFHLTDPRDTPNSSNTNRVVSTTSSESSFRGFETRFETNPYDETILKWERPKTVRNNNIDLLMQINNLSKTTGGILRKTQKALISSVSPRNGAALNNDNLICHICHFDSSRITNWKEGTNEHPFIKTVGAMFHHLLDDHCNKTGKQRQLTEKVEKYLKEIWKEFEADKKIPFLQTSTSIPKASSTSCLQSAWKSNQTNLNKERFNRYVFDPKYCKGHVKPVPMEGLEHWDLADTVYCPCVARKKKIIQTMDDDETIFMMNQDLAIQPIPLFCKRNKQSIIQNRRTFLCSYLIPMERPESRSTYPYRT